MKSYLVMATSIVGEFETDFLSHFYVKEGEDIDKIVHEFFVDFYGEGSLSEHDDNMYLYNNGCGVKVQSVEVGNFPSQIVRLIGRNEII